MSTAEPLTTPGRLARYFHQNGNRELTPKQVRRIKHKQNRAIAKSFAWRTPLRAKRAAMLAEQAESEAAK